MRPELPPRGRCGCRPTMAAAVASRAPGLPMRSASRCSWAHPSPAGPNGGRVEPKRGGARGFLPSVRQNTDEGEHLMPKTVTLRLDDSAYEELREAAVAANRPLSNLIETAALSHLR